MQLTRSRCERAAAFQLLLILGKFEIQCFYFYRNPAQPQTPSNWMDMNRLAKAHSASNNRDGRLNTECEINNRSAANLRSLNVPSVIGLTSQSFKSRNIHHCSIFMNTVGLFFFYLK